jgi:hypothetical protein
MVEIEFEDANCSEQLGKATVFTTYKCIAASQPNTWITFVCSDDGKTFVQKEFTDPKCTGDFLRLFPSSRTSFRNKNHPLLTDSCMLALLVDRYDGVCGQCAEASDYHFLTFQCNGTSIRN